MKSNKTITIVVALATILLALMSWVTQANAQTSFSSVTTINTSSPSQINSAGSPVLAIDYYGTNETVNGISFVGTSSASYSNGTQGVSFSGASYYQHYDDGGLSTAYGIITGGGQYNDPGPATLTFTGLTAGTTYQAQLFVLDARGYTRSETISAGGVTSGSLQYGAAGGYPAGSYVIATFTPTSSSFAFTITGANGDTQLNAVNLLSGGVTTWAFNTASSPATGYTSASLSSQPISMVIYTGATTVTAGSGGTFTSATGNSGFYYNSDIAATVGQTVTESATLTLGSNATNNVWGGGYQYGVVCFQLWTGPNAASGTSMAVLALANQGGTSYNAMINGTSENASLTINPTDTLVFTIVDTVGGGGAGEDALTASITDNGTTIYSATLNVTTSTDGAYSYRMYDGPTTITFTNMALGVSGNGTTWAFNTDLDPATGYTSGSLSSQPISMVVYNGATTVTPGSGGTFGSATGNSGFYYNSDIAAAAGKTVTETATLTLGTDAQDNAYGGGYQSGVVNFQLWTGPNAASGTSMAVLALESDGGTSYNAQLNGTSENSSLTIHPTDQLVFKIADAVGAGPSGQDALTATIIDNGTTIYTATLNVTTSSDGAYSYRMYSGPTTITYTHMDLGVSGTGTGGGGSAPVITSAASANGTVGTAFSYTITATNSPTSYSETGTLPAGLGISGAVISGTPTAAGTTSVTVKATNSSGTGSATLTITIVAGGSPPVITSSPTTSGTTGTAFSYQITATNSPTGYSYSGSLPSGLSFNTGSGAITGTPSTAGAVALTITASNSGGNGSAQLIMQIASPGMVSLGGGSGGTPGMVNDAVAIGTAGKTFSYEAKASNAPYLTGTTTFSATNLPPGLSIANAETSGYTVATGYINTWEGLITGTPSSAGTWAATVTAVNSSGSTTVPLLFVIRAATSSGNFYTTYKDGNGVWWFKDPNGNEMVMKGVDMVQDGPIGSEAASPLNAALMVSDDVNTLGAWSAYNFIPIPGTSKNIGITEYIGGSSNYVNGFPDVFSSAFVSGWATAAANACGQFQSDPAFIGYYSDNELDWGYEWTIDTGEDNNGIVTTQLLWSFMGNPSSATYTQALNYLQNKYGMGTAGLNALNASWQTSFTSWSQIGSGSYSSSNSQPSTTGVYTDCQNFAGICATQYFSVVKNAIRAVDPNHLILGCKFASTSHVLPAVVAAEAPYVDVISIDCYQSDSGAPNPIADVQYYYASSGNAKPVMIGEFSFCSTAQNNSGCGNAESAVNEPTQAARATGFQTYVQDAASCKAMIGYCWFLGIDWPGDCDYGLVDETNTAYAPINNQFATTNPTIEGLHASANQ